MLLYTVIAIGDINGSGTIDLADVIRALQIISGIGSPYPIYKEADVNTDGRIDLPEVIYCLQKASGVAF